MQELSYRPEGAKMQFTSQNLAILAHIRKLDRTGLTPKI